jgi:hypothetical protein
LALGFGVGVCVRWCGIWWLLLRAPGLVSWPLLRALERVQVTFCCMRFRGFEVGFNFYFH